MILVGNNWHPPQLGNLVGAWVAGRSGPVNASGTWAGQYGTRSGATLKADALVTADGLTLDGTGDYADCGDLLAAVTNVTYACWCKTINTAKARQPVMSYGYSHSNTATTNGGPTAFIRNYNSAFVSAVNPAIAWHVTDVPTPNGEWIHIVAGRGPGKQVLLWVNGVLKVNSGSFGIAPPTLPFCLGREVVDGPAYNYLAGSIDCAYVWSGVALSAAEVYSVYAADPYRRGNR